MFSTVESLATKRANHRPVASSIMLISSISSPRPSNQSWSLVSHCTNFAIPAPSRPPFMNLLHALLPRPPQFRLHHPLPYRLPAHLDIVLLGQILRRQRRPKSPVHRLGQNRHRLPPYFHAHFAIGSQSPKRVHHRL